MRYGEEHLLLSIAPIRFRSPFSASINTSFHNLGICNPKNI